MNKPAELHSQLSRIGVACETALREKGVDYSLHRDGLEAIPAKIAEIEKPVKIYWQDFMRVHGGSMSELPVINMSNASNADNMFNGCTKLSKVHIEDMGAVVSANNMFNGCSNLSKVYVEDMNNVTSANSMFLGCRNLREFRGVDLSNCNYATAAFQGCSFVTLPSIGDTSKVINANSMFRDCASLVEADVDLSSANNVGHLFYGCGSLKRIKIKANELSDANNMFAYCHKLEVIEGVIDLSVVVSFSNIFVNSYSLREVRVKGVRSTIELHYSDFLSRDSILYLFENVPSVTTSPTIRLRKSTVDQARVTPEEIAIATNKGWRVQLT